MWTITRDYIEEGKCVGTSSCDFQQAKLATLAHRFRMLDADGEVYFEGVSNDASTQRAFAPLDDFGQSYAGCVSIEYLESTGWRPT
jgi:hypothetical protein